jgi:hypothetical protein
MRTLLLYTNTIHDAVGKEGENGCVNYAGKRSILWITIMRKKIP